MDDWGLDDPIDTPEASPAAPSAPSAQPVQPVPQKRAGSWAQKPVPTTTSQPPAAAPAPVSGAPAADWGMNDPVDDAPVTPPRVVTRFGRRIQSQYPNQEAADRASAEQAKRIQAWDTPAVPVPPQRPAGIGKNVPVDDTGMNVPERPETLAEQQRAVAEGRKPAVMFPTGTQEPQLAPGMARIVTPRGIFHFNPQVISPAKVMQASRQGRENDVLGLGPFSKDDVQKRVAAGEPPLAVTERTPAGIEVKAAVGTPSTMGPQVAAISAGAAPGNVIDIEPLDQVVNGRFPNGVPAPPVRPAGLGLPQQGPPMPWPKKLDPNNPLDVGGPDMPGVTPGEPTAAELDKRMISPEGTTFGMLTPRERAAARQEAIDGAKIKLEEVKGRYEALRQKLSPGADADERAQIEAAQLRSQAKLTRQNPLAIVRKELSEAQKAYDEAMKSPGPDTTSTRAALSKVGQTLEMLPGMVGGLARPIDAILGKEIGKSTDREQERTKKAFPVDAFREKEFGTKAAGGVASSIVFMLAGGAGRALGLSAGRTAGATGALHGANDFYREAEKRGEEGWKKARAYLAGALGGSSEGWLGTGRLLDQLDKTTNGGVRRYFGLILQQAGEEGLQEGAQTLYEAIARHELWKVPLDGIGKEMAEGILIGALTGGGMAASLGVGNLAKNDPIAAAISRAAAVGDPAEIDNILRQTLQPSKDKNTATGQQPQEYPPYQMPQAMPLEGNQRAPEPVRPQEPTGQFGPQGGLTEPLRPSENPSQKNNGFSYVTNPENQASAPTELAQEPAKVDDTPPVVNSPAAIEDTPSTRILRAAGWADEDIADLQGLELQQALTDAAAEGITDPGPSHTQAQNPTSEGTRDPVAGLEPQAQAEQPTGDGTRGSPVKVTAPEHITPAAEQVNVTPTPAQAAAGNYKKGHIKYDGFDVALETPKGSTRSGKDADGTDWEVPNFPAHYGYIKGTTGADGDQIDVFIGDKPPNGKVYVVDQYDPKTGKFDEHKLFMGVESDQEAAQIYHAAYPNGPRSRLGAITELTRAEFDDRRAKGQFKKAIGKKPSTSTEIGDVTQNVAEATTDTPPVQMSEEEQAIGNAITTHLGSIGVDAGAIPPELMAATAKKVLEGMQIGDAMRAAAEELDDLDAINTSLEVTVAEKDKIARDKKAAAEAAEAEKAKGKKGKKDGAATDGTDGAAGGDTQTTSADTTGEAGRPDAAEPQSGSTATGETGGGDQETGTGGQVGTGPGSGGAVSQDGAGAENNGQAQAGAADSETGDKPGAKDGPAVKVDDAGEKLGGARKDEWRGKGMTDETFDSMSGAERAALVTKENVWPRPDYESWVQEDGVDPQAIYLAKLLYDGINTKPVSDSTEDLKKYINAVRLVRSAVEKIKTVGDARDVENVAAKDYTEPTSYGHRITSEFAQMMNAIGPNVRGRSYRRRYSFTLTSKDLSRAKEMVGKGWPAMEGWKRFYAVRGAENKWRLVELKNYNIHGYFDNVEQAEAAARALYDARMASRTKDKLPDRPHLDNITRSGPDYRKGKNVTADDFVQTFGFRGVEFGNWLANDERQKTVNLAFDAMHDLARVLGVAPKAMSLDGTLGVGFGSRGRGGRAAAHYEPHLLVINMTKLAGAGSLAHEWAHAFDHYLGELNQQNPYSGATKSITGWRDSVPKHWPNLSLRMQQAITRLMSAITQRAETNDEMRARLDGAIKKKREYIKSWEDHRAKSIDRHNAATDPKLKKHYAKQVEQADEVLAGYHGHSALENLIAARENPRERHRHKDVPTTYLLEAQKLSGTGDYWHRPNELFARAFESYVFDKITAEGLSSQYLVQGVEETRYASGYKGNPYPAGDERKAINKAFDDLVARVEATNGKNGEASKLKDAPGKADLPDESVVEYNNPVDLGPVPGEAIDPGDEQTSDDLSGDTPGAAAISSVTEFEKDAPDHVKALKARLLRADGGFGNILEARRFAREHGFKASNDKQESKEIEEAIEHAITLAARQIISASEDPQKAYDELVKLYERQPNLATRTSQSVAEQAYSTPIPLAFIASRLAGIDSTKTVLEPTAGTGMLLVEADPKKSRVNEINKTRFDVLKSQGFNPSSADGASTATFADSAAKVDVVIANPPFGAVKDGGQSKTWTVGGLTTTAIDHAISLNALTAMKDNGRAVLIIGGVNATDPKERGLGYTASSKRKFFRELLKSYNVVDHFTVSGDLYKKQGAGWPVDVIVIDGRGPSNRPVPSSAEGVPTLLNSWDELREKLDATGPRVGADSQAADGSVANEPAVEGERPGSSGDATGERPSGKPAADQDTSTGGAGPRGGKPGVSGKPAGQSVDGDKPAGNEPGGNNNGPADPGGRITDDDVIKALDNLFPDENPAPEGGVSDSAPAEQPTKPEKPAKPAKGGGNTNPRPTAGDKIKEAGSDAIMSMEDIAKGLDALFKFDPMRMGSGPSLNIDPEKYAKAKVFFRSALEHFKEAAQNAKDALNLLLRELVQKFQFTREKIANMAPYITRFVNEWTAEQEQQQKPKVEEKAPEDGSQAVYKAASKKGAELPGIFVPGALAQATQNALERLEDRVGPVDDFVAKELGIPLDATFTESFSQAQVDALALAIDNAKRGRGFVIGDQTGIGKGRVVAGMIVWAKRQGLVPIFVTEKPDLYGDMWRDLHDIRYVKSLNRPLEIFMTNNGTAVALDDEAVDWKSEYEEAKEAGEPLPERRGQFSQKQAPAKAEEKMRKILSAEYDPDVVFTTYDQMNSKDKGETPRRRFLSAVADRAFVILDESHNAGGQQQQGSRAPAEDQQAARSALFRSVVAKAKGVMYSSATFAKSPGVMDLYSATDMMLAVKNPADLGALIAAGGVPLQQAVSMMLTEAGQYIRRERTFEGVDYISDAVPINDEAYANFTDALGAVFSFDRAFSDTRSDIIEAYISEGMLGGALDNAVGDIAANATEFSSIMHNIINQMILSIKADAAADRTIEELKAGRKPIIALASTMEAFISDFAADQNLKAGDNINLDFKGVIQRYLKRTRRFTVKVTDEKTGEEVKKHIYIDDDMMPPEWLDQWEAARQQIEAYDFSGMPVSPIDHIRNRIVQAGYSVKEVTGRTLTIDYSGKVPVLANRDAKEKGSSNKRVSIRQFNSGKLDAIILNRAGSTGVSLHASSKFKDQRRRTMILLQADPNPDVMMQMLGRPHRTGQVIAPMYVDLQADIPAEVRPAAVRMKKLASLNANTTAARTSKFSGESPDFINDYGDRIVARIVAPDFELQMKLGWPLKQKQDGSTDPADSAARVTGRLTLLKPAEQQELIEKIVENYNAEIARLDEIGENKLEAKFIDLQAKGPSETIPLTEANGPSPFEAAANFERFEIKASGLSMKGRDVVDAIKKATGFSGTFDWILDGEFRRVTGAYTARLREEATRQSQEYDKEYLKTVKADKLQAERDKTAQRRREFDDRLRNLLIGMQVMYDPGDGTETRAVIIGLKQQEKLTAKNPIAPSNWMVTIAIPDGRRTIGYPLSAIEANAVPGAAPAQQQAGEVEESGKAKLTPTPSVNMAETFDDAAKMSTEKRWFITGNLLTGYDRGKKGQITTFSHESGDIITGIQMPRGFDPDKFMNDQPVRIENAKHVLQFVRQTGSQISSMDRIVNVSLTTRQAWKGEFTIDVPAAKSSGGRYYGDAKVRQVYDYWEKKSSRMTAVVDEKKAEQIVSAMMDIGAVFIARTNQTVAKNIIEADKPKSQPMAVPRPAGDLTQKAVDAGLDRAMVEEIAERTLRQILGPAIAQAIKVRVVDQLTIEGARGEWATDGQQAYGMYHVGKMLIDLSMITTTDGITRNTVAHEVFHFLQSAGAFTQQEIAVLQREMPRMQRENAERYGDSAYSMDLTETTAMSFGYFYDAAEGRGRGPTLTGRVRRLFMRILNALRRIRNYLDGLGLQTADDVFERVRSGGVGQDILNRQGQAAGPNWFRDSNLYNATMAVPGLRQANPSVPDFRPSAMSNTVSYWADSVTRLREWQRKYRQDSGMNAPDVHAAYGSLNTRIAEAIETMREDEIAPLARAIEAAGGQDVVDEFLYARHAEEVNQYVASINPALPDGGSGMMTADAQARMQAFQASPIYPELLNAAQLVERMNEADLDYRQAAGLINQQQRTDITSRYQFYVPLKGFKSDFWEEQRSGGGAGVSVRGSEYRRQLGRRSEADSPVAQMILQRIYGIQRAQKNRTDLQLMRFAQAMQAHYGTDSPAIVRRTPPMARSTTVPVTMYQQSGAQYSGHPDVIELKIAGKSLWVEFKGEPKLADALRNAVNEHDDKVWQAIASITSVYAKLRTAWNVFFAPTNFVRDLEDAMVYASGHLGPKPKRKLLAQLPGAFAESWKFAIRGQRTPEFDQFRHDGAKMSWAKLRTIDEIRDELKWEIEGLPPIRAFLRTLRNIAENWNDLFENTIRFAVYRTALSQGFSRSAATKAALEATLNFHRRGRQDSVILQYVRAVSPFINPAIQSPLRAARMVRDVGEAGSVGSATRTQATVMALRGARRVYFGLMVLGFIANIWNYMWGGDDDDGIPFWDKTRDDYRNKKNLIIYIPFSKDANGKPNAIVIPAFAELVTPWKLGGSFAAALLGKVPASEIIKDVAESAYAMAPWEGRGFVPSAISFIDSIGNNKNFFGGRIHPEPRRDQSGVPRNMIQYPDTPQGWRHIAKAIHVGSMGLFNLHPEDVRHIAREAVGGYYNPATWFAGGTGWSLSTAPVARSFYADGGRLHAGYERAKINELQGQSNTRKMEFKTDPSNTQGITRGPRGGVNTPVGVQMDAMRKEMRPIYNRLTEARKQGDTAEAERLQGQINDIQKKYRVRAEQARGNQ